MKCKVVAIVLNEDGSKYDSCYTWEAGLNYALHEGRKVVAIADDGTVEKRNAQAIYDNALAEHNDCWGKS